MGNHRTIIDMRVIVENLCRRGSDEERRFNRDFWRRMGPDARFAAAWEMVVEAELFKNRHASESRLQRSVQHIERRAR